MSDTHFPLQRVGLGQDSHRFYEKGNDKPCILGGVIIEGVSGFDADSDGDVILHAICNAITSLSHVPILGKVAKELCHDQGVKDSKVFLQKALQTLKNEEIVHVAISIEGKKPRLQDKIDAIRENIASLLSILPQQVGMTVTSGDFLTSFGRGEGVQCLCLLTTRENFS